MNIKFCSSHKVIVGFTKLRIYCTSYGLLMGYFFGVFFSCIFQLDSICLNLLIFYRKKLDNNDVFKDRRYLKTDRSIMDQLDFIGHWLHPKSDTLILYSR